jgi:hypothetical protein
MQPLLFPCTIRKTFEEELIAAVAAIPLSVFSATL